MDYVLGKTNEEFTIDTADENREMILDLVRQATHSISIFSQDLDDRLYDNFELKELMTGFVRNPGNPRVRILVQDLNHAILNSHRIVRLSQTLSSYIFVRQPCDVFKIEKCEFITVDDTAVLYRVNGDHGGYHADVNFMSPSRAQELNHFFVNVWEQSEPSPDTRQLVI